MLDTTTAEETLRARMEADAKRMRPNWRVKEGVPEGQDDTPYADAVRQHISDEPQTARELAAKIGCDARSLSYTLRLLRSRGEIDHHMETRHSYRGKLAQWVRADHV